MPALPAIELLDLLQPAYSPCAGFSTRCAGGAKWAPESGHVPRGYLGATARLDDVDLILLVAEPGDPHTGAVVQPRPRRKSLAAETVADTYRCFLEGTDLFHRNVRQVLDLVLPGMPFDTQLSRTWITNTYLCSAPQEAGYVPSAAERFCAETYLQRALTLLPGRPIIALGAKAERRVRRLRQSIPDLETRLVIADSAAPPGATRPRAQESWRTAAEKARVLMDARRQVARTDESGP